MDNTFFFITSFDSISGSLIASILNEHPDFNCQTYFNDPFSWNQSTNPMISKEKIIDQFIAINTDPLKKFNGSAQRFSAYELQHRILTEKCKSSFRRGNIGVSPALRINFLVNHWIERSNAAEFSLVHIEQKLNELLQNEHPLFSLYAFRYYYNHVMATARKRKINLDNIHNRLFLIALTKVIAQDAGDLPYPGKTYSLESLLNNEDGFISMMNYLTYDQCKMIPAFKSNLKLLLQKTANSINTMKPIVTETWQMDLIETYAEAQMKTIYYPHIDKPLSYYYKELGYQFAEEQKTTKLFYSKLISIHLNSNRPTQLLTYFDNIEETADHPEEVEVLVNIDHDDHYMQKLLTEEIEKRRFTLKFIATERPKSFCDLWKPINKLLELADPNAYFMLNISDEMLFATQGWDTLLKKYIGFFPDHLFRLRASRNKFRNYFDRWECSFAQDSIPFTTKKWIDVGGDWNPCFGPDSFQQLVIFYLAKQAKFSSSNYLREIPIIDIKFHGDVPGQGIDHTKSWKHNSDHIKAMQICQSYPMQLEANRRAMLIKAHIIATAKQLDQFKTVDNKAKKKIQLLDSDSRVIAEIDYALSWFGITFTNQFRKLAFNIYFGGGKDAQKNIIINVLGYLKSKHQSIRQLYFFARKARHLVSLKNKLRNKKAHLHNVVEENKRLKKLYLSVCLENEKLTAKQLNAFEILKDRVETCEGKEKEKLIANL